MERLTFVQHRGIPILVADHTGVQDPDEWLALIRRSSERITAEPPGSVRLLLALQAADLSPALLGPLKDAALRNRPHLKGVAVVGLTGLLRVVYQAMARMLEMEMPAFDTRDEALDWLAGLP